MPPDDQLDAEGGPRVPGSAASTNDRTASRARSFSISASLLRRTGCGGALGRRTPAKEAGDDPVTPMAVA